MQIDGARIVITGAGSGIGRATARHCARRGAEIVLLDIDAETAEETAGSVRAEGGRAVVHSCDVTDRQQVEAMADRIEREEGPVDVLVSNAGVGLAGRFLDTSIEDWRWLMSVNLDGVVHGCHAFAPRMAERGRGHLVNIASMAGFMAHGKMAAYCTSKAAVIMFSQCLRAEMGRHGVGVSALCPGVIDTPIGEHTRLVGPEAPRRDRIVRGFSHGHDPEAVAKAVAGAVQHNRELVPVGVEASVAYRMLRLAPGPVRGLLARLPLG